MVLHFKQSFECLSVPSILFGCYTLYYGPLLAAEVCLKSRTGAEQGIGKRPIFIIVIFQNQVCSTLILRVLSTVTLLNLCRILCMPFLSLDCRMITGIGQLQMTNNSIRIYKMK